ncbi:MAG: NAD-dependent epimerase/dehydratase family protein [Myxococcaceae bacterium]
MNVLVTGATGFLGTAVVQRLAEAGHRVRMVGRHPPGRELLELGQFHALDLEQPSAVRPALAGMDALLHLAGRVSFDSRDGRAMYRLHVDATRALLEEIRANGGIGRLVLASTSGTTAVSRTERVGREEDTAPLDVIGRWPYYLSKVYEERLTIDFCRKHAIPLVVCNPSLLLGPGDTRLSSTWTVAKFLQRDLPSMPNGGMCFVDVRDAAAAFVAALSRGELYGKHLMGVNFSMADFFQRLERLSGVPAPRLRLPSPLNVLGAQLLERWAKARGHEPALNAASVEIAEHWFWVDSRKAEQMLGFRARDPHQTLLDTVTDLVERMPEQSRPGTKGRLAELRRE